MTYVIAAARMYLKPNTSCIIYSIKKHWQTMQGRSNAVYSRAITDKKFGSIYERTALYFFMFTVRNKHYIFYFQLMYSNAAKAHLRYGEVFSPFLTYSCRMVGSVRMLRTSGIFQEWV